MGRTIGQYIHHRPLKRSGQGRPIGPACDTLGHRGFQAREAEVASRTPQHRPWQRFPVRPGMCRSQPFERRSARPGQAKQFTDLVERLPDGIVDRATQAPVLAHAVDRHALAVPTGQQQQQIRKCRAAQRWQPGRERMRLQMVDADEGQACAQRNALAHAGAHDQPADQARPAAGRDAAQVARTQPGLVQHVMDQARQRLQMSSCRDFRYDAAIGRVLVLAQQCLGQDGAVRREYGRRGFVA